MLVGPAKYQTKLIYVLNTIFLINYFYLSNTCTRRIESTSGNSKPILNKNLNYKITLQMVLRQEQYSATWKHVERYCEIG